MMTLLFLLTLLSPAGGESHPVRDTDSTLTFLFWNVENFFDTETTGPGAPDFEWSEGGARHWDSWKYWRKCHLIAKTFLWTADLTGRVPDVIGVAEVEGRICLDNVARNTLLKKLDYVQVHHESRDRRGIDVALLYRSPVFRLVEEEACPVVDAEGDTLATRDILHVCLEEKAGGGRIHFLVNHHPSKYGGTSRSASGRESAMMKMLSVCDSVRSRGDSLIVCMGDFNDVPEGPAFDLLEGRLANLALPLSRSGQGTIRFDGKWEMIDMFLVSSPLTGNARMEVCRPPFLLEEDHAHMGHKPFRTWTGPRYNGGASDHLPILMRLKYFAL